MTRATLLSLLKAGDWSQLASLAERETGTAAGLLRALAAGHAQSLPDFTVDDVVPDDDLRALLRQAPAVIDRLLARAREAAAGGRLGVADALYRAVLALDDRHLAARLAVAWEAFRQGDRAAALHHAELARQGHPGSAEAAAAFGWMQWDAGRPEAVETLETALAQHPDHPVLLWYLGHIRARTGLLAAAERLLTRALEINPGLDEAAVALAWVYADMGRLDAALDLSYKVVQRAPQPHRLAQLGHFLSEKGFFDAAILLLRQALAATPADPDIRRHLVTALCRAGQAAEAGPLLDAGLALAPEDRGLHLGKALWLRTTGAPAQAEIAAHDIVRRWPDWADGWYLLGEIKRAAGAMQEALHCYGQAQRHNPALVAAAIARSQVLLHFGAAEDAATLMDAVLADAPDHPAARRQLAWALIGQNRGRDARPHLHRLLRGDRRNEELFLFLSVALHQLGRLTSARLIARRARRIAPDTPDILRHCAGLALEAGDFAETEALCGRLLQLAPDQAQVRVLTSFALQAQGRLSEAEHHAERAILLAPETAETWRCLAQLRHRQHRLDAAEAALRQAQALAPKNSDALGQLAWVLATDDRLPEALAVSREAAALTPKKPERWLELAEILALTGATVEALACLDDTPALIPPPPAALSLAARLLAVDGTVQQAAGGSPLLAWQEAARRAAILLYRDRRHHDAGLTVLRLHAAGYAPAADLLRLIPLDARRSLYLEILEWLAAYGSAEEAARVAAAAQAAFPRDVDIAVASLYLLRMAGAVSAETSARHLRQWGLMHGAASGRTACRPPHAAFPDSRLQVAYLASHFHQALLVDLLAAHDPTAVGLHLYTDDPAPLPASLRQRVAVHPLSGTDLEASCIANHIDVVVDTVGLHPFHGQAAVLRALRRRIAPLQCGWLGAWGSGAGLYDLLITDAVALPPADRALYTEPVLRLSGGQWSWSPPAGAPPVVPLPAQTTGGITFGCAVRGFRLSPLCLETWADLLAAVPGSRLVLLGRHGRDWEFRQRFATILAARGVAADRIVYRLHRPYGDHFHLFDDIDIGLDSFPANGGLGLIDALWMGVPVVTLTGEGLAARQGAALLTAAGAEAWIAATPADYIRIACALAADPAALAEIRQGLRDRLRAAPLLDARRVAAQLEQTWVDRRDALRAVAEAPDLKSRCRALARHAIAGWLADHGRLTLPVSAGVPDVSVVLVLFNQAGLTLQTLTALADQTGLSFETIIVDNASTDETAALLDRIHGATLLRNAKNEGFLRAANQGAARATGRYILFLNNDALPHPGALAAALHRLKTDPSIGVVGGRILLVDGTLQEAGCMAYADGSAAGYGRGENPDLPEFRFVRDADFVSGAFLMLPRPLWSSLGGFDPAFAPAYYEDTDLCFRVRRAGFRVVYDPAVTLTHLEGGSAVTADAAGAMMRANQGRFLAAHRDELAQRATPANAKPLHDRWVSAPAPRVLVLDNVVPHQAVGAGNPRARLMLQSLTGCHVTYFPLWGGEETWEEVYATLPETIEVMLGQHATTLERFLEQRQGVYDLMIVSRPPNMDLVAEIRRRRPFLFEGVRVIYDAEALFALRDIGLAALRGTPLPRAEAKGLLKAELDLAAAADCVLTVSEREARLFKAGGAPAVQVLSHAMPRPAAPPPFEAREGFLFIGALTPGSPNEDSLVWLSEAVLPRLNAELGRALPVTIVGECKSSRIAALASDQIRLVGRVDDLGPAYDAARVFIAPTRFGAGVPLKVIEAACAGIPVVATRLLVRQLGWKTGIELLEGRDAEGFAAAMARLYHDPARWLAVREAALRRAETDHAPEAFTRTLRAVIGLEGIE